MGMIHQKLPAPTGDGLDVTMRALYDVARFSGSVARIGMTGPDVASHVAAIVRRAIAHVEAMEKVSFDVS